MRINNFLYCSQRKNREREREKERKSYFKKDILLFDF